MLGLNNNADPLHGIEKKLVLQRIRQFFHRQSNLRSEYPPPNTIEDVTRKKAPSACATQSKAS
jgi:hypothetical protein